MLVLVSATSVRSPSPDSAIWGFSDSDHKYTAVYECRIDELERRPPASKEKSERAEGVRTQELELCSVEVQFEDLLDKQ